MQAIHFEQRGLPSSNKGRSLLFVYRCSGDEIGSCLHGRFNLALFFPPFLQVSVFSRLLVLLLCVLPSHAQDGYSGYHSGDEHTYEGSLVDNYVHSGYAQPEEYPPEPTDSYEEQQPSSGYDPYAPAPTSVSMITEDSYPYTTTTQVRGSQGGKYVMCNV
uniref:Uncharacterized protein n=1 Tax=Hucho hucho TaxID=62062 RepID=A0A4W5LD76_9TELE